MSNVLELRNLSIAFDTEHGPVHAVRNVSFSVPGNQVVGVVGESGCGKTTVISAAMGLLADNASILGGEVIFEGGDILGLSEEGLADLRGDRITMVFQDPMTAQNPVISIGTQMVDIQYRRRISPRVPSGTWRLRCYAASAFPMHRRASTTIRTSSAVACFNGSRSQWR